ncbi:Holliday junction resolvase RuvX [Gryllotalpicola protaetiae]|uniref:Putative pre-16S rRNA nuclease n=1 Tax=Gryllotalpicola protaetiae TaxID=2419771 RepID=A0A387BVJ5_9MICO|nr:Holliday junction resolvase RuvX [Gryllotalpicola protaetiae]AYG04949.1 Holliday junction resolvase RuvX [Gryllotalpicola protaetiae]
MRTGIRLGIDVGTVRIGVSRSDPSGFLASPLETVARADDGSDVARIVQLVTEHEAIELVVGLPLALSGRRTASTEDAVGFAERLAGAVAVPVRLVDERLSTVTATVSLRQSGKNSRKSRSVVDQSAAAVILQHALDAERSSGRPAGSDVSPPSA